MRTLDEARSFNEENSLITKEQSAEIVLGTSPRAIESTLQLSPPENTDTMPITLWADKVTYEIKGKRILDDISFTASSGELTAVLGPSGSGKTTLLNCLMSRVRKRYLVEGSCGINCESTRSPNLKYLANYVLATDNLQGYLTVQETIYFAARLRLPHLSSEEQIAQGDKMINWLQLESCRHTLVGSNWRKGLSTGQQKRLAIAQAILGDPRVLLLDEPTTGLDSALALELVGILRSIARKLNAVVVATIHQPSAKAYSLFDRLVLLSEGSIIYQGPSTYALTYFAQSGLTHDSDEDELCAPDYLLYLATDDSTRTKFGQSKKAMHVDRHNLSASGLRDIYVGSDLARKVEKEVLIAKTLPAIDENSYEHIETAKSWWSQFLIIWKRQSISSLRNPLTMGLMILINALQAVLLGAIFFNLTDGTYDMTLGRYDEWSIWENPFLVYLTEGLDRNETNDLLFDPLRDMIETGINSEGADIILDIALNQEMVDWISDVSVCLRETLPQHIFDGYPDYKWPDESNETETKDETLQFGSMTIEQFVSTITSLMQSISGIQNSFDPTTLSSLEGVDDGTIWYAALPQFITESASAAFCCLGFEYSYGSLLIPTCSAKYPDQIMPTFPGRISYDEVSEKIHRFTRMLIDRYRQLPQHIKLQTVADTLLIKPPPMPKIHKKRASRRMLGSGLGGIVTDLWAILFDDPSNPLYPVANSIRSMLSLLQSDECQSGYCDSVKEWIEWFNDTSQQLVTALLALANISGALYFLVGNIGFASYDVLLQIPRERPILNRERADGFYTTSAYFLGRMCADLPFQVVPGIVWAIVYWAMLGMTMKAATVFTYLGTAILASFTAYSFGYLISSFAGRVEVAILIAPMTLIVMLILAGFFVRDAQLRGWIRWAQYISIIKWAFNSILLIAFPPGSHFGPLTNELCLIVVGAQEKRLWVTNMYLMIIAVSCRLLAYLGFRFCHRHMGLEA